MKGLMLVFMLLAIKCTALNEISLAVFMGGELQSSPHSIPTKRQESYAQSAISLLGHYQALMVKYLRQLKEVVEDGGEWIFLFWWNNCSYYFRELSYYFEESINSLIKFFLSLHWVVMATVFSLLSLLLHRSWKLSMSIFGGCFIVASLSLWNETIETIVLVSLSTILALLIGIPVGIAAAYRPKIYKRIRPILDFMRSIPTPIYFLPTLILFGLGMGPGLISTVLFSVAAPIRATYAAMRQVHRDLNDVIEAFGANFWQRLIKLEMPSAFPEMKRGVRQCVMLSFSMLIIAAFVGAQGLGKPLVQALNTADIKLGCQVGIAIIIVSLLLDKLLPNEAR
ncbi:MAG: ABC transporter permease subunit [Myxococcales bacterium]|nr:ABC transporter permease subunit [Myxococcales bacterium]USN50317.1 MAG: ABC transporter permease subunit [Myxococcales bacterium]